MIRMIRRLWWRLRRGRPTTPAEVEAIIRRALARFCADLEDAGLPTESAYASAAATLVAQAYGAILVRQGAAKAHVALQQILVHANDTIARMTGMRPFEIHAPPETPKP